MGRCLVMVLIPISLECLLFIYWPSRYFLIWSSSSGLLPILGVGCVFLIDLWELFMYYGYAPFIRYMFHKWLLSICGLSFHSFNDIFWWTEVLNSMKSNLSIFSFMVSIFDVLFKKPLPTSVFVTKKLFYFLLEYSYMIELSVMMEKSYICTINIVVTKLMCLLSIWNVSSMTEEMNIWCYLI